MQTNWAFFGTYWPFLVPLIILEFGLMITAVVHVLRHPHYRIIQIIGPIAYFVFGREDQS